ncbi:MAG: transporter small permease [Herminiimonas sp.]|nr:transporter small permease [Herminiimonas sp.]
MLDRIIDRLMKGLEITIALMLGVMVVLVFGNVVLRYGFNSGIAFSEEASRYLFVWVTFLGAIIAVREHTHLGVDTLVRKMPRKGKIFLAVISDLLIIMVVVLLFQGSVKQTIINYATTSPVAGISLSFLYVPGVIASAAIGVLTVLHLYQILFVGVPDEALILTVESEELAAFEQKEQALKNHPASGTKPLVQMPVEKLL